MRIVFVSRGNVEAFESFDEVPYKVTGFTSYMSKEREQGRLVHREELDNKPEYENFAGPMWDGDGLRYETWDVYDMLSR